MSEDDFWTWCRDLYKDIWNCPYYKDCKAYMPEKFVSAGQYCQVPFIGAFWWDHMQHAGWKPHEENLPTQLFVAYNPRLGSDEEEGLCVNTWKYAQNVLQYNGQGIPLSKSFDEVHYPAQVAGAVGKGGTFYYGFLQNEMWSGKGYKYGIREMAARVFGLDHFTDPQHIAFCNLVPCSGPSSQDTPNADMEKRCRDTKFLPRILRILTPDILWVMGTNSWARIDHWMEMDPKITWSKEIDLPWARILQCDTSKTIVLQLSHPAARTTDAPSCLQEEVPDLDGVFEFYKTFFKGWENHLHDLPDFLERRL